MAKKAAQVADKPLQYLDKAMGRIRDLGLWPEKVEEQPITGLLQEITDLDETRVVLIGRTLNQASTFNDVVREQVASMNVGSRYETITKGFDSIRDDAKGLVDQLEDSKIDFMERISNVWMKVSRGDISTRFNKIRDTYLEVSKDTKDQIERETTILEAYRDFRGALVELETLPPQLRAEALRGLAELAAEEKHREQVLAALFALPPGGLRSTSLGVALREWAREANPTEALQWLESTSLPRDERARIEQDVGFGFFYQDHRMAADWIMARAQMRGSADRTACSRLLGQRGQRHALLLRVVRGEHRQAAALPQHRAAHPGSGVALPGPLPAGRPACPVAHRRIRPHVCPPDPQVK